jgi:CheB methylesterase
VTAVRVVVVVEDSPVQRAHLVGLLQAEHDITVIGQAADPAEAERQVRCRVRLLSGVTVVDHPRGRRRPPAPDPHRAPPVAIAASTGGPAALAILLPRLGGLAVPVLVVQDLHPHLVDGFVGWMQRVSALPVVVAADGDRPQPGSERERKRNWKRKRGYGAEAAGPGGLWTAGSPASGNRLRSPTGGLGVEPPGSRTLSSAQDTTPTSAQDTMPTSARDGTPRSARDMGTLGQVTARRGDHFGPVVAFRKAMFLDPDQPATWFELGMALGTVDDSRGARRAYAAALAALEQRDPDAVRAGLDGWAAEELAGALRAKLGWRS